MSKNLDAATVKGFGEEWSAFDQSELQGTEYRKLFEGYFGIFPFDNLPSGAEGFDLGCGSGRWAATPAQSILSDHFRPKGRAALERAGRATTEHLGQQLRREPVTGADRSHVLLRQFLAFGDVCDDVKRPAELY